MFDLQLTVKKQHGVISGVQQVAILDCNSCGWQRSGAVIQNTGQRSVPDAFGSSLVSCAFSVLRGSP